MSFTKVSFGALLPDTADAAVIFDLLAKVTKLTICDIYEVVSEVGVGTLVIYTLSNVFIGIFKGIRISNLLPKTGAINVPMIELVLRITFRGMLLKLSNYCGKVKYKYWPAKISMLHIKSIVIYVL